MKKRISILALCLCFALAIFAGCSPEETTAAPTESTTGEGGEKDFSGRSLDVLFMVGGQGEMANPILATLEDVYPGLETNVTYDHNAADILRSRILAGNPP